MPLHPFLLALFPPLFAYYHNFELLEVSMLVRPVAVIVGGTMVLWLVLRRLQGPGDRPALTTSLLLLLFFSFGHVRMALDGPARTVFTAVLWPAACVAVVVDARRSFLPVPAATKFLDVLSVALVLVTAVPLTVEGLVRSARTVSTITLPMPPELAAPAIAPTPQPDVFVIVLDAYDRRDVRRRIYDYDDGPFVQALRDRGFFVADRGRSNYPRTAPSVSSFLNLQYLDALSRRPDCRSLDMSVFAAVLRSPVLFRLLRSLGYRIVTFAPCGPDGRVTSADTTVQPWFSCNELEYLILETTAATLVSGDDWIPSTVELRRRATRFVLERLPDVAGTKGPTFVYAHLLQPHFPNIFGPDGSPRNPEGIKAALRDDMLFAGTLEDLEGYRDQVAFISSRVLDVVDRIRASSERPPIIVIMGDHGGFSLRHETRPEANYLDETHGILLACAGPADFVARLRPDVSSVNVFRALAGHLAGRTLPELEDRCFFSLYFTPAEFRDVTDLVGKQPMATIYTAIADGMARKGDPAGAAVFRAKADAARRTTE